MESGLLSRLMHVDVAVWVVHDRQCDGSISEETVQPSATLHSPCHNIVTLVALNGHLIAPWVNDGVAAILFSHP